MAEQSAIEWTDSTFNPWIGCTKVGPGCDHCYAEAMMDSRLGTVRWGAGQPRKLTSTTYWRQPLRWEHGHAAFFTKHGRRRRVFCASLADVFDNEVDPQWRSDLFDLIKRTPNLDWQLLTKRIGNVVPLLEVARNLESMRDSNPNDRLWGMLNAWLNHNRPPANVWVGATVVNQAEADRDIPKLLATPARIRFLSIEPMLGPVDLDRVYGVRNNAPFSALNAKTEQGWPRCVEHAPGYCMANCKGRLPAIDWVICGGESGPNARPMHPDWVRSLRDQCAAAGVPFLFKQWGKKKAGRMLDGRLHNGFPATPHSQRTLPVPGHAARFSG